jgi:hypothetical protein
VHSDGLHNLYFSPNRMMKSTRMRWAGHVARLGGRGDIGGKETARKTETLVGVWY